MIFEWGVRKKFFRNINHAIWFLMSMWLLILTAAYYFYPGRDIIILFPLSIHFVAFLQSLYVVYVKKEKSETISKDCVWFNPLMILVYIILFFLSR